MLTCIPESAAGMKSLARLDLYNNRICLLPGNIGKLKNLKELYIGGNPLNPADIPSGLASRSKSGNLKIR